MVDSLKVEVELSGAEKLKADLAELGAVGQRTFLNMAAAAAKLSAVLGVGFAVGIVIATRKLNEFANAAEETEKALTQLQKVSGESFQNLSALANVFARGGTSLKQFASEFGNLSEQIAAAGEEAAKQDAIKKQAEDAAKGLKVTELGAITLNERATELKKTLSNIPVDQRLFALADVFKNIGDTVERARLGQALGLSPEFIATLSQGSAAIQQLQAEAQRLGLTLTTSNQQALQEMAQAWNQFTALLSAFFQKIGALAAPAFTQILTAFQPVMQQIVADFENLPIGQAIANLGNRLAPAFTAIGEVLLPIVTQIGIALGSAIIQGMSSSLQQGAGPAIQGIFSSLPFSWAVNVGLAIGKAILAGAKQAAPAASGGGDGFAGGGLLGGRGTGTSDSNLAWVSRGEHIMPARVVAQPGVLSFLEALRRGGGIPGFAVGGVARGGNQLWNFLDRITTQLDNALRALNPVLVNTVLQIAKSVEMPMQALLGLMNKISSNAGGGLLGGRGTGTSDSNLAWVSRGEYITPARAVAQPGVLAFLEALRRSGGNLTAVLNGMGRFALGGMVPRTMPAFASGGLAGGSNVTIQFPGLPAIGGLRASADVVEQLHRAAALAQVRSGGRKPSRYS